MNFTSERMLVETLVGLLEEKRSPWGEVSFTREFDYSRGRTDLLAVCNSDTLIAIEAKLKDWKYALHQAYRNTCFAHRSFVLLPKATAVRALRSFAEFEKRRVGLCYIENDKLVIVLESHLGNPIEPWLSAAALARVFNQ